MSKEQRPVAINLHRRSQELELSYAGGRSYRLPAEYLRVYSPSAEVMGHGPGQRKVPIGKENVNIDHIEPVGNYAVLLHFDDGHNTGIYSWETLYNLGRNHQELWAQYLNELEAAGHKRKEPS